MASLKTLSDDDLRQKLKQYGITSPVTSSTRDILIKKLNHAIVNQKKSSVVSKTNGKPVPRKLHTFSSDEDEEDDSSIHDDHPVISFRTTSKLSRGKRDTVKSANETPVSDRNGATTVGSCGSVSGNGLKNSARRLTTSRLRFTNDLENEAAATSVSSPSSRRYSAANSALSSSSSVLSKSNSAQSEEPLVKRTRVSLGSGGGGAQSSYYPMVSARSGISPRAKIHDDYDTGSDSDLAEGEDVVGGGSGTSGGRENRVHPNNSSFSTSTFYQNHKSGALPTSERFHKVGDNYLRSRKKKHELLENGRWQGEGEGDVLDRPSGNHNKSFSVITESIVSETTPIGGNHSNHDGIRVANGRHHSSPGGGVGISESNNHSSVNSTVLGDLLHPSSVPPGDDESTWHYSIPLLLLVLLVVFFGVVAMLYVNMRIPILPMLQSVPAMICQAMAKLPVPFLARTDSKSQSQNGATVPLPPPPPPSSQSPENRIPLCSNGAKSECLTVQEMTAFRQIAGRLEDIVMPALHRHEGQFQCGEIDVRHMSVNNMQNLLQEAKIIADNESSNGVVALGKLADMNRHWGIETIKDGETLLGISLVSPPTHVLCHIKIAVYNLFHVIIGLILATGACWLTFTYVKYHRHKKETERHQVLETVEQILETLGGLAGAGGKDFVAVNHVRDSLIGPRDREAKDKIWKKAVAFLDNYESRIRREIQSVGGEDCEIWRWTSGVPFSPGSPTSPDGSGGRPPAKMWQGQAFESLETTHNLPNVSPTSCLKIRNMFDCDVEFGDSWPSRIQDSILEKCEGISIVHIAVDRGSREGCVYLKCASLKEAGRAFRALHGWWYDGNLVTVKFLRDERYHQRFPSARHATQRLQPSNNKRLSLQVPTRQSDCVEHP